MAIHLHHGDLPDGVTFGASVAVDSETMGLKPGRDRLCLVQLSAGDGDAHLVKFADGAYQAPNLTALMADPAASEWVDLTEEAMTRVRPAAGASAALATAVAAPA